MPQKYSQDELLSLWSKSHQEEEARRQEKTQTVVTFFQSDEIPTPDHIVQTLMWKTGSKRLELLRHHSFWKEKKLRHGFNTLVKTAFVAHLDLLRCEAALTAYADSRDPFTEHVDYTVNHPAQKEVMAFCAAYSGTIDTLRRIKSVRPDLATLIDELRKEATSSTHFRFVHDLRTNLSHGAVTMPDWNIATSHNGTSGSMKFHVDELLAFGKWSSATRVFLQQIEDGRIDISEVTAECARGLTKLRRNLDLLFSKNRSQTEDDFYCINDQIQKSTSCQFLKIFLQPHIAKGTDPYPYLGRFFSGEVVREILRREPHSIEQVEFIISLRASDTLCEDELRTILYNLFGVQQT